MVVPSGAICKINYTSDGGGIIEGVLSESVTVSLQSDYQPLFSDNDIDNDTLKAGGELLNAIGTAVSSGTGKRVGFSTRFKQGTTQVWKSTAPASFQIGLDLRRDPINGGGKVSGKDLMEKVKIICKLPLPSEGDGTVQKSIGNLIPPGPSFIQGVGIDAILGAMSPNKTYADITGGGLVKVTLGNISFNRLILKTVEPTFSQAVDNSGYPISCRLSMQFTSIWAATNTTINEWVTT